MTQDEAHARGSMVCHTETHAAMFAARTVRPPWACEFKVGKFRCCEYSSVRAHVRREEREGVGWSAQVGLRKELDHGAAEADAAEEQLAAVALALCARVAH